MLQVWGRRSSLNVQKVMWLIGELGLAHQHIPAGWPIWYQGFSRIFGHESPWPSARH